MCLNFSKYKIFKIWCDLHFSKYRKWKYLKVILYSYLILKKVNGRITDS